MAITITHITRATTGSTASVTVPAGTKLLVMIASGEASATPFTANSFPPTNSGSDVWVEFAERLNRTAAAAGTTNVGLAAAYIANPTAGTFTMGVSNVNGWGGSNGFLQFYAFDGTVDTADPIGGVGYGSANNATETVISFNEATGTVDTAASLVTETAGGMIVAVMSTNDPETWTMSGSGWTEQMNVAGTGVNLDVQTKTEASAAVNYGATTWTAASATNRATTIQFEVRNLSGSTETITVTNGALTIAGQTVVQNDSHAITNGALTIAGQTVVQNDAHAVTNGSLTIAGQTVTIFETNTVPVTEGTLTIAGQTITVADTTGEVPVTVLPGNITIAGQTVSLLDLHAVAAGSLTIAGETITVTDTTPAPPPITRAKGGGSGSGLGPASPASIAAWERRQAKERDLWQRIDDSLHGRSPKTPDTPPAPPQTLSEPLPPAPAAAVQPEPDFIDLLVDVMSQDGFSSLMLRHDFPHYDPEEDAAALLLLS